MARYSNFAYLTFMIAMLVTGVGANLLPDSKTRATIVHVRKLRAAGDASKLKSVDKLFAQARSGNVFLHFDGLDPNNVGELHLANLLLQRGSFAICPRRVIVSTSNEPILEGNLLKQRAMPTDGWLRENGVHYVYLIRKRAGRIMPTRIRKVAP